jgi:hypothetical protein
MKRAVLAGLVLAWSALAVGSASLIAVSVASQSRGPLTGHEAAFDQTLAQVEAAQVELVRGRPATFKALWSKRDDVTLTGGLGGTIEKGWDNVSRRLDWVSSQYADGNREHEEVVRFIGQDVAYVVQKEVIRFRVPGQTARVTQELRAVMVFRLESGTWRMSHRQADSQTTRQPAR